jgi:hypothetical protein
MVETRKNSSHKSPAKKKTIKHAFHKSNAFKKILSIGFECETHDLAKLNLSNDGKILYNTEYMISSAYKNKMQEMNSRVYEIKDNVKAKPFLEVFNEPLYDSAKNVNPDITFQITNDVGNTPFIEMVENYFCEKDKISKDKMYVFKPKSGKKEYKIHFTNRLKKYASCGTFSGVEFIGTYFKPTFSNTIILDTFKHFCTRIIDHFSNLTEIPGDLLYTGDNSREKIGYLEKRILYHKPETNLYYLQTFDDEDPDVKQTFNIDDVVFSPQTTFSVKAEDLYDVLKALSDINIKTTNEEILELQDEIQNSYLLITRMKNCAKELLQEHNSNSKHKISVTSVHGKRIINALMMIFYKMEVFNEDFYQNRSKVDTYFKDFLTFSSRHRNDTYYQYIKSVIQEKFNNTLSPQQVVDIVFHILNKPDIVKKYMYAHSPKVFQFRPDINHVDYGNLRKSFLSYFDFLEQPTRRNNLNAENKIIYTDYLTFKDFDTKSTTFPLVDNLILIEFRDFVRELQILFNRLNVEKEGSVSVGLTIRQLKEFVRIMNQKQSPAKLFDKEYNPNTNRFVKKCKEGYERDKHFRCKNTLKRRLKNDIHAGVVNEMMVL